MKLRGESSYWKGKKNICVFWKNFCTAKTLKWDFFGIVSIKYRSFLIFNVAGFYSASLLVVNPFRSFFKCLDTDHEEEICSNHNIFQHLFSKTHLITWLFDCVPGEANIMYYFWEPHFFWKKSCEVYSRSVKLLG